MFKNTLIITMNDHSIFSWGHSSAIKNANAIFTTGDVSRRQNSEIREILMYFLNPPLTEAACSCLHCLQCEAEHVPGIGQSQLSCIRLDQSARCYKISGTRNRKQKFNFSCSYYAILVAEKQRLQVLSKL